VTTIASLQLVFKALRELGPVPLGLYAWYQLGLRSGYWRWKTRGEKRTASSPERSQISPLEHGWLIIPPKEAILAVIGPDGQQAVLREADEIAAGRIRLFGGPAVPMRLTPPASLKHWTAYKSGHPLNEQKDVKWIWEPGRFGWACTLARAYHISGEEYYAEAFWKYTEEFLDSSPPYLGPQWISAQEAALRLVALAFASQVLVNARHSTSERLDRLAAAIADHAERIPPTMSYARAQNNNHLLTEAVGLITAGRTLPSHPRAGKWMKIGWHWLNQGLQSQIEAGGSYIQHSCNYHRLMLQVALWTYALSSNENAGEPNSRELHGNENRERGRGSSPGSFPRETMRRLAAATEWLWQMIDAETGQAPNLGPNDSAYILALTACPLQDYRPVLQAASLAFLNKPALSPGWWDEMSLWFGLDPGKVAGGKTTEQSPYPIFSPPSTDTPAILRGEDSWAYLRVATFNSRPGHADQLNLDLWWRGLNLAQDPGTYLYNAEPPWDNSLAGTGVHNTITIEGQDQMTRAGRFLWLDWAQGEVLEERRGSTGWLESVIAQHDGYRNFGVIHQRAVEYQRRAWIITDTIHASQQENLQSANRKSPLAIRLHWLLPDWPWDIRERAKSGESAIKIDSPHGWIELTAKAFSGIDQSSSRGIINTQLVRAGRLIYGQGRASPMRGWISRNYGYKTPALSFSFETKSHVPVTFISEWRLPL